MESSSQAAFVPTSVEKARRKRTLDDKACEVCEDKSTGKHYGVYVCDGCSGFFKRTVRRAIPWVCRNDGKCIVNRASRTDCRACRFKKCLMVNMNPEGVQTTHGSRANPYNENDANSSFLMNVFDQLETTVQTVEGESRSNSSTSSISSLSTSNPLLPVSSSSPPITMATSGGSGEEFQNRTDSPVLIKVETERCDTFTKADHNSEIDGENSENESKGSVASSQALGQPTCTQTGMITRSQPVRPVVPFIPTVTQQTQLVSAQMLVVPNTSFTRYPYQPPRFPSTTSISTSHYALTDRQNCSPANTARPLPPGAKDSSHNMAVQLLSNLVQFAKNIPSFKSLPFRDQVILLEESWKDMFILDAAFWSFPLEISYIIPPGETSRETNAPLLSSLRLLQELVTRIQVLELDETECGYLKTVILFNPDIKGLKDSHQIEKLQDEVQIKLSEYTRITRVGNSARFGRLLLTLLALERVTQEMIEKLFFRAQNYSVDYILHDIFKKT